MVLPRTGSSSHPLSAAVEILDWYHAMEHVWPRLMTCMGRERPSPVLAKAQENLLWNAERAELLVALQDLAQQYPPSRRRSTTSRSSSPYAL